MMTIVNKRAIVNHGSNGDGGRIFRKRLHIVIARTGGSDAAFARAARLDRSTLSQLLTGESARLPRAETLLAVARAARVSVDWLLGLSQREEAGAEIIEAVMSFTPEAGQPMDDSFVAWLAEADGQRVRTVPAHLPDFLKTDAVLRAEYDPLSRRAGAAALEIARGRLAVLRQPEADLEVCLARQTLLSFARGEAHWSDVPAAVRREQLAYMADVMDDLYPRLRVYLYDLRDTYSAPFTVFGSKRVAIFLGQSFLVLSAAEHIRLFARRFDDLIRGAVVQPNEMPGQIRRLITPAP